MILLTPRRKIYGWIPDLPDHRDKFYKTLTVVKPEKLPSYVDLRPDCSPIEDQGELGSCTANALVGNLEYLKKKQLKEVLEFSRLFIYYNERVVEHTTDIDSGAMIRDGIKTLAKLGCCPELEWPYIISKFAEKPPEEAYKDALSHLVDSYYRLGSLNEMKHTLASNYPFVFGFSVYESFESDAVARTGIIPMPMPDERLLGGHAVMAVGYDDSKEQFIVRNSWGTSWGQQGYFMMPYVYLMNSNLSSDFWTIRSVE